MCYNPIRGLGSCAIHIFEAVSLLNSRDIVNNFVVCSSINPNPLCRDLRSYVLHPSTIPNKFCLGLVQSESLALSCLWAMGN